VSRTPAAAAASQAEPPTPPAGRRAERLTAGRAFARPDPPQADGDSRTTATAALAKRSVSAPTCPSVQYSPSVALALNEQER